MSEALCRLMRHVLITGGSSGLGAALASSYAAPGVTISLIGRSLHCLETVAAICRAAGATVRIGLFDVGDPEPLGTWLRASDEALPFDLLIANAGTSGGPAAPGIGEGLAVASRQVRTNLLGCVNTIEPLLPALLQRSAGRSRHLRGHVAVVSSVAGYRGLPYSPAYSASKAGVRLYGDALRAQLSPYGLDVSVIIPGFFDSPMTDRFNGAKPMLRSLEKAASTVRRGLDKRAARIVFPRLLGWGIQATDFLPARVGDAILRGVHFQIKTAQNDFPPAAPAASSQAYCP